MGEGLKVRRGGGEDIPKSGTIAVTGRLLTSITIPALANKKAFVLRAVTDPENTYGYDLAAKTDNQLYCAAYLNGVFSGKAAKLTSSSARTESVSITEGTMDGNGTITLTTASGASVYFTDTSNSSTVSYQYDYMG